MYASSLLPILLALVNAGSVSAFICPTPVIPGKTPSNACCRTLTLIPGAGSFNPAGGDVYWGTACVAAVNNVTISVTQEDSLVCGKGLKDSCCDPTFRQTLGSGPCTIPTKA